MHTLSLRAFRSATLGLQNPHLATRPGRFFHASTVARAADEASAGPRDDGSKPERENGAGEGDNTDENLFGESNTTANGESQGRKRTSNGSLRSRTLRNRKPEELPPVHVPKSFFSNAVSRFNDTKNDPAFDLPNRGARILMDSTLSDTPEVVKQKTSSLVEAVAWTEESIKRLELSLDGAFIRKKGDTFAAAALWAAALSIREAYGNDAATKLLDNCLISNFGDLLGSLSYMALLTSWGHNKNLSQVRQIMDNMIHDPILEASAAGWFEEELIEEVIASIKTDLLVLPPKNVKLTDLRRPVTIINVSDYSGHSVPRDIVRHVADKLEADVLHLRASDIAHIVGSYLGQDAVRAPGAMSLLGYKTAEISGRLKANRRAVSEESDELEDIRVPYTIFMRDERLKKDNKRYISLMDEFLNGPNRGKNDELWEDLKVNTALEELVHTAFSESEKRPLIVHIDDFNAINMDLECGAMIIGKIRKVVDGLWADGRKIALVGSCTSKGAPRPYINGLRELGSTERVITLRMAIQAQDLVARAGPFTMKRNIWESRDFLSENEGNIVKMLASMVEPGSEATVTTTGELGLSKSKTLDGKLPESWSTSVLPLTEVYRIATTMIGHSKNPADVFNIEAVERAAEVIKRLDQLKEKYSKIKIAEDKTQRREPKDFLDTRKLNSSEENHEEALESGLVNAEDIRTTFKDVHAPKETIESVKMLTTLSLIRPEAFSYGVLATDRIPGCLLYGPPGTGKTLLAKAVAKESGANMIEISGASINNKYVGESEKTVRALFGLAKKKEPLVIFIDEADALLGARGRRDLGSRRETINQFLREWDGMDKMKAFIMVATNRPFDLDEAVLRRLPRKLLIDLPLEADRAAILRIHLKDELLDEDTVSIDDIAKRTPLYSGSDLKNVCVAAAMAAVKEELELELEQQKQESDENNEKKEMKKRVLAGRHFDKALREIGASVSEDMATLTAIRKFDEKYGDGGAAARRRRRKGLGFEVVPDGVDAQEARVRKI
ncbi:AAA-domain-containing protein [Hypoxylon crocopeplum]|nr:AAA-domain-containing protein [Hypoxylon crocopeplum]